VTRAVKVIGTESRMMVAEVGGAGGREEWRVIFNGYKILA
jgi:hypothetical protein